MSIGQMCNDIYLLKKKLRSCLKPGQSKLFDEIISQIQTHEGEESWKYEISIETPLSFRKDSTGQGLEIDVFGYIEGIFERTLMLDHCITVRLWTFDRRLAINERLDSPALISLLEDNSFRRVVLRFRFDKGTGQEFAYHIQIGGYGRTPDEHCWYPSTLDIPRFPFFPMNLFLVCEFILANFYPHEWYKLRDDQVWQDIICRAQQCMLNYFESLEVNFACRIMDDMRCRDQKSIFSRMSGGT